MGSYLYCVSAGNTTLGVYPNMDAACRSIEESSSYVKFGARCDHYTDGEFLVEWQGGYEVLPFTVVACAYSPVSNRLFHQPA
jgi:hypothetical protein